MKNSVGILNFFYTVGNYGALLQAAALEQLIRQHGDSAEHISLIPKGFQPPKKNIKYYRRKLKRQFREFLGTAKVNTIVGNPEVFESFRKKWITSSNTIYSTVKDLSASNLPYDTFVTGSDQVWRWEYTQSLIYGYFLSFASQSSKKIAFAPSFGLDYWENSEPSFTTEIKEILHSFDAISVREKSGVEICKEQFDISAEHVLDPTLVVDKSFYLEMMKDTPEECTTPDLVYYKLDVDESFLELIESIEHKLNCTSENIYYREEKSKYEIKRIYSDVPSWLTKIKNCETVITDSFHCVCFSLIFEKNFIYYPNESRGMARLESLLSDLDLLDRIYTESSSRSIEDMFHDSINYERVNTIIKKKRETSLKFLYDALEM